MPSAGSNVNTRCLSSCALSTDCSNTKIMSKRFSIILKFVAQANAKGCKQLQSRTIEFAGLIKEAIVVQVAFYLDVIIIQHLAKDAGGKNFFDLNRQQVIKDDVHISRLLEIIGKEIQIGIKVHIFKNIFFKFQNDPSAHLIAYFFTVC